MAASTDPLAGQGAEPSGFAVMLSAAAERNRLIADDAVRKVEDLERRVVQSRRMIEQAARTMEATRRRHRQLARIGL